MAGWTKKPRNRFKHHLFRSQKFCRGYAWDWLCDHAAFSDVTIDLDGKTVHLKRGQLTYSIRFLAGVFGWDKAAVSRFLTRLKTEGMIETASDSGQTLITICNYERFNGDDDRRETPTETPTETAARQQRDSSETNNKNDKNYKNDNRGAATGGVQSQDELFPKQEKPKRKAQFPEDWKPDDKLREWAREKGYSDQQVAEMAERCVNHHRGKGNTFLDHNAAFRTWVLGQARFASPSPPTPSRPTTTSYESQADAIMRRRRAREAQN